MFIVKGETLERKDNVKIEKNRHLNILFDKYAYFIDQLRNPGTHPLSVYGNLFTELGGKV